MEASTATPTTGSETQGTPTAPSMGTAPATEAHTGSQGAPGAGAQPPETGDDERDPETGRYLSREAASYRRRLRETETERDALRAQLDQLQRVEVERIASASGLAVASDVWMHGASLDTLRGEDGSIDSETVSGLVSDILKDRPGLRGRPAGDLGIGRGATAAGTTVRPKVGLSALLKPGRS